MECDVCEQPGRRKFYCEVCLKERLLIHRSALKRLGENHEATVKKSLPVLEAPGGVQERRIAKARRAKLVVDCQDLDRKNQQLVEKVQRSRTLIEKKRIELTIRRNRLQEARQRLEYQRTSPQASSSHQNINPGSPLSSLSLTHLVNLRHQAVIAEQHWGEVLKNLTVVRRNLISQLVSIYPITYHKTESQEPTRISELEEPHHRKNLSDSTSAIVRTEWKITGLCLPTPAEVKLYPCEEVSAAVLYTAHFLRLAAMYIGIKLPFQLSMGPALSISAPRYSVWKSNFPALYPLHLPVVTNHSNSSTSARSSSHLAFVTGLSMLAYNCYYIFESQRTTSGLSPQSTRTHKPREVLQSLYGFCHTPGLGSWSHVTGKELLKRPGNPSQLPEVDLEQLVSEALQIKSEEVVEEDWSLI